MMMMMLLCVDVDVAEPDEKSLITYVSSLYDVFPDVPSMEQSLRDSVCSHLYDVRTLLSCVFDAFRFCDLLSWLR